MKKNRIFHLFRFRGGISIIYYIIIAGLLWYLIIPNTSLYYRNNVFNPFFQRLNEEDVTLVKGESFKLYYMGVNKRVNYTSTDIKVADVSILGNVTAYRAGTTFIKVKVKDKVLKCRVRVIEINKVNIELKAGQSYKLKIHQESFGVRWYSSDKQVATVSRFGKVTAVSKGNAIIYGKIRGKTVSCKVKVK